MAIQGADPESLRQTAAQLGNAAARLDEVSRQMSALLASVSWQGPAADHFRYEWNRTYRARLAQSAAHLRSGQTTLRTNADQQQQTSGAEGGASSGGGSWHLGSPSTVMAGVTAGLGLLGGLGRFWSSSPTPLLYGLADRGTTVARFASQGFAVRGAYTGTWRTVIDGRYALLPGDWWRFKSSPVLQGAHALLKPAGKHLETAAARFRTLGPAALGLSLVGHADAIGTAAAKHDYFTVATESTGTAADLLKTSKNPTAYLGGVAVQTYTELAKAIKDGIDNDDFSSNGLYWASRASWRDWGGALAGTVSTLGRVIF